MSRLLLKERSGKKVVCALLLVLLGFLTYTLFGMAETEKNEGYDIVFAIDNSGSISKNEQFSKSRSQAFERITNAAEKSNTRIGVVFFGDLVENGDVLPLTSESGTVISFLEKEHKDRNNNTDIGEGLKCAQTLFDNSSREQVIFLFTDGVDDNDYKDPSKETKKQVQALKDKNIPIYCVYLKEAKNDMSAMKNIVSYYGDEDYSSRLVSTDELIKIMEMKALFDGVDEKSTAIKLSTRDVIYIIILLCVVVILGLLVIAKKKGRFINHKDDMEIQRRTLMELRDDIRELETLELLCTQEIVKIRKAKNTMLWNGALGKYDFSLVDEITGQMQGIDSFVCETKMRANTAEKNSTNSMYKSLQDLCFRAKQHINNAEKSLEKLRKERETVTGLVSKYS